jgi:hypothetical protein
VVCAVAGASSAYGRASGWLGLACAALVLTLDFGLGSRGLGTHIWHAAGDYRLSRSLLLLVTAYGAGVVLFAWPRLTRALIPGSITRGAVGRAGDQLFGRLVAEVDEPADSALLFISAQERGGQLRFGARASQVFGEASIDAAHSALLGPLGEGAIEAAIDAALDALDPDGPGPNPDSGSTDDEGRVLCFPTYP